jgi:RHS repeat-associated protein
VSAAGRLGHAIVSRLIAGLLVLLVAGAQGIGNARTASASGPPGVDYTYDENGRLLAATDPNGDTAVYHYDVVGNILSIGRHPSSDLSIVNFSPSRGTAGTAVTISGTGFASTPAANTVTFNGVAATVTSASPTRLVAQVPAGASSGDVAVSTGGTPVMGDSPFTKLGASPAPTIGSISPTVATTGSTLTISGTNFQPSDLTANRIAFNGSQSYATAGTGTSLTTTIPPTVTSGHVTVATADGTAVGPDLVVPPAPYTAGDVLSSARFAIGDAPQSVPIATPSKVALLLFDGTQGTRISLNLGWTGGGSPSFTIYAPNGRLLWTTGGGFVDPVTLSQDGTYTLLVAPSSGASGTASVEVWSVPADLAPTLTLGGAPVTATTTVRGQNVVYSFPGAAGQRISARLSATASSGSGWFNYTIRMPGGAQLYGNCCDGSGTVVFADPLVLPVTGTYTILVDPTNTLLGTASAEVWEVPADTTTAVTLGDAPAASANTVRGQNMRYTFSGTAGQRVSARLSATRTAGGGSFNYSVLKPDGSSLYGNCCNGSGGVIFVDPLTLPVTGTYTILVDPTGDLLGTTSVEAWDVPADATTAIALGDAPAASANTVRGQNVRYTFSGIAGQRVSARLSATQTAGGGSFNYSVLKPDGSSLYGNCCNGSGGIVFADPLTLPVTGTYTILVDPSGDLLGTTSAEAWDVPADATTAIALGDAPAASANTVRGQNVRYTFGGTAGQRVSARLSATRTSGGGSFNYSVLKPDGSSLYGNCCNGSGGVVFVDPLTLPVDGTYTILVDPTGDLLGTTSVEAWDVPADATAALTLGADPINLANTVRGQNVVFTFAGTSGQQVSAQVSATLASGSGSFNYSLRRPDGSQVAGSCCNGSGASVILGPAILNQTGTFTLVVDPTGDVIATASAKAFDVPVDVVTPLTLGAAPLSATSTVSGQNLRFTFTGTAGQRVSARLSSTRTGGSGSFNYSVLKPDGGSIFGSCCNGSGGVVFVDPLTLPVDGTYTILVDPTGDLVGTASVEAWDVPADANTALTMGAAPAAAANTVRGQNVRYTFSGTAGQRVSARLTATRTSGSGSFNYSVLKPDGSSLFGSCCNGSGGVVFVDPLSLPATGTYTILVDPTVDLLGTTSVEAWDVPADPVTALTMGAAPVSSASTVRGQNILFTFPGTSGQQISTQMSATLTSGSGSFNYSIRNPDGSTLASSCCNGSGASVILGPVTLSQTGTFTITVDPTGDVVATASAKAFVVPVDVVTPITLDAAPVTATTTVSGQNMRFTFTGTAGQRVSARLSATRTGGSGSFNYSVLKPDGSSLYGNCCNGSGGVVFVDPLTLPVTGTYTILVDPTGDLVGTASVEAWDVPSDATTALTLGAAATSSANTVRGQNIAWTFTGAAGQRVAARLSATLTAGSGSFTYSVRKPDGSSLYSNCCNGSGSIFVDPLTLPVAGTYTIVVDPSVDAIGTATAEAWDVPADAATALTLGAAPAASANTVRGQNVTYTFTGAANQRISARLSSTLTAGSGSFTYTVRKPDGSSLYGNCCNGSGAVIFVDPLTLPVAGTYTIVIDPSGDAIGNTSAEAWDVPADAATALTLGDAPAASANTVRGQNVTYTFTGAANQRISARLSSTLTAGSGSFTYTVRKPDGSSLYGNCCNGSGAVIFVDPLTLPVAGTYTIVIDPSGDAIGNTSAEAWDVPADATASLVAGAGPVGSANAVRGQNVVYSFSGTSGQKVTIQASATRTSGTGSFTYTVRNPAGASIASNCCNGSGVTVSFTALSLAATGTFTLTIDPSTDAVGTTSASLTLVTSTAVKLAAARAPAAPAPPAPPTTPAAAPPSNPPSVTEDWLPGARKGQPDDFRTHLPSAPAQTMPMLQAAQGVTAVSGQALKLTGEPLAGVTLRIGDSSAVTDATGRFLLQGLAAGHAVLEIDGTTANRPDATYGFFEAGMNVVAGQTSILPFPVWMTRLDTRHEVTFPSPTTREVVLTNPAIPGLEIHLPAGSVVKDRTGHPVTRLGLTAIPVDRTPFPLPIAVDVPIYFTVQPGGDYVWPKGARIVYPNFTHLRPGARVQFWDYDPEDRGWFVYGEGSVTRDGRQVVPDPGVVLWGFSGAMFDGSGFNPDGDGPGNGDGNGDGDPVDLATGIFAYQKTDLVLPDTLPLALTRSVRRGDGVSRAFGMGMTHSLDINLFSRVQYQEVDLYLPGRAKIHYVRTSPGTSWTDAVFQTSAAGTYGGSTIAWNGNGWNLTRRDGMVLVFGENAPLQSIRDRNGNQITLIRSSGVNGVITEAVTSNGRWLQFTYDGSNRITAARDNIGRSVTYTYDGSGRLATVTDPEGGITTYAYDAANDITSISDARGNAFVTNVYDTAGRVTLQTLPGGAAYQFVYTVDGSGRVTQTDVTDPRGVVHRASFDAGGATVGDIAALGRPEQNAVTITRDPATELPTSITDAAGRTTALGYDARGNVTSATRMANTAEAQTSTMTYDPVYSQVTSVTDPLGHTSTVTYDARGNAVRTSGPGGHTTTIVPRADGRPASITDALGHTTTFMYALGDLSAVTDPLGRTQTSFTDGAGRVVASVDGLGNRTVTRYDRRNLPTSVADPTGATTAFAYDANGNVHAVADALGHQTTFAYDPLNRLTVRTDPLGREQRYGYDPAGNLTAYTDANGQTTAVVYDGLNRRAQVGFNAVTAGGHTTYDSTVDFTYDAAGRLGTIVDSASGTITQGHDDYDRLTSVATPQGSIAYTYDAGDHLASATIGSSPALVYEHDADGRLTAITQSGTTLVSKTFDAGGRLTSLTLPNGIVETPAYDDASQLTGITYALGGSILGELGYEYDAAGRRTAVTGSWARTGLPQPVSSATYDAANQLSTWNGTAVTYDDAGQLVDDGTTTYLWNARHQLTGLASAATSASFGYDGLGRRTQTTVNGTVTQLLYDGTNVVQELTGGSVSASILSGATDEYFSRTDAAGTRSFLTDALGSTVALTGSGGDVATAYTYEPYGAATATGAADANPLQFTGRENDGTGLQYNRARYYSPALGRFISTDPLGFGGGDVNTSAYTGGSPTNLTDPSGEFAFLAPMAIGCALGAAVGAGAAYFSNPKASLGDMLGAAGVGCALGALGGLLGAAGEALLGAEALGAAEGVGVAAEEAGVAAQSGTALARALGAEGEELAGINAAAKVRIPSLTETATYRVPDALSQTTLTEVKNVAQQGMTNQLRDFLAYAQQTGRSFDLIVRENTVLSSELQGLQNSGAINVIRSLPAR